MKTTIPTSAEKLAAVRYEECKWSWTCACPDDHLTDVQMVRWIDTNGEWFRINAPTSK